VEFSVHRPSPPDTYSYVREENLGSTRKEKFLQPTRSGCFYLCIREILFVAQIIPPRGTFICAQKKGPQYANTESLPSPVGAAIAAIAAATTMAVSVAALWLWPLPWLLPQMSPQPWPRPS
jgi:hypothetical protein